MTRLAFGIVLSFHALIHLMGFVKAFNLAPLPQLTNPISRPMGLVWLAAGLLLLASTVALFATPRWFWLLAGLGVVVSQIAILSSWHDARVGTVPNVLTLLWVVYGASAWGPFGLRAEYEARTSRGLARLTAAPLVSLTVTEAELTPLPMPVQRYLRYVGVVGHPHVQAFRVRFTGRIRSAADAPWMPFVAEQQSVIDPPTRLFSMDATMRGLPVDVLHVYDQGAASMRVKLLSLFPVVSVRGATFTRAETVTLFNDLCILSPAALVDPAIHWKEIDTRTVEATYTRGADTIRAVLLFDDSGPLTNFWSDDRPSLAPDGVTLVPQRWSTPVGDYRVNGPFRLASRGEARYAAATGDYAYIQFDGLEVSYDLPAPAARR